MSLVIPDEFLQTAQISEADLKLDIAVLLFLRQKITLSTASQFAGINPLEFERVVGGRQISTDLGVEGFQPDLSDREADRLERELPRPTQAEILQRIEERRTFSPAQHQLPGTLTLLQEDRAR